MNGLWEDQCVLQQRGKRAAKIKNPHTPAGAAILGSGPKLMSSPKQRLGHGSVRINPGQSKCQSLLQTPAELEGPHPLVDLVEHDIIHHQQMQSAGRGRPAVTLTGHHPFPTSSCGHSI